MTDRPPTISAPRCSAIGDWRVEKLDDDGGIEVAIFSGPDARDRAIEYADWRYRGDFKKVSLPQMRARPR
jgi:hypothetical protein